MPSVDNTFIWSAVVGICLLVLRLRWGAWLLLPAGVRFVLWPLLWRLVPGLPIWAIIIVVPLTPIVLTILFLRGSQAVLTGIFGKDVAVRVVSHGLVSLIGNILGGFGRGREQRINDPVLPRPNAVPFRPLDHGGEL